ncbi:hypothetical protein [Vibrio paucivorans]
MFNKDVTSSTNNLYFGSSMSMSSDGELLIGSELKNDHQGVNGDLDVLVGTTPGGVSIY